MIRGTSCPRSRRDCRFLASTAYLVCSILVSGLERKLTFFFFFKARHDVFTAARTTKLGLKLSLVYGLAQDALESLKGNRPAYVDFLLGNRQPNARKGETV